MRTLPRRWTPLFLLAAGLGWAPPLGAAEAAGAPAAPVAPVPAPAPTPGKDDAAPAADDPVVLGRLRLSRFKTADGEAWLRGRLPATPETDKLIADFKAGARTLEQFKADLEPLAAAARKERMTKERARIEAWVFDNLKQRLDSPEADFEAIRPLLIHAWAMRRQQKSLFELLPSGGGQTFNFDESPPDEGDYASVAERLQFLGLGEMDPAAKGLLDAIRAFRTLTKDPQASPDELARVMAGLRLAKAQFQAVVDKAQAELKSVLTRRQEALMVECGLID